MSKELLGAVLVKDGEKRAEFSKRNKPYIEKAIEPELRSKYEGEGWWLQREFKTKVRMRKDRPFDEALENRFWNILYRFGYDELNKGRDFKIATTKDGKLPKQIDVFARDDETVVVAECKACSEPSKRALQKDIAEFCAYKKEIANAIRKHYGAGYSPKIIWCFVTDNIRWSDRDLKQAADNQVNVIQGVELIYFEEFSKKLGPAARHQFQAEYLADQKVPALQGRKVPAVKTKLGGVTAYLFSALASDILKISFVNHRDLRDPSGAPSYQRIVKPSRLKQIGKFLDGNGYFPNTILLNFHRKPQFEQKAKDDVSGVHFGDIILPDRFKSCWVIDGQHRLYGTTFTEKKYDQPLFFIGFDKVDQAREANIFVEINSKQDKVAATLLSALDGEVKWDSPVPKEKLSAIASRAVDILNSTGGGPIEGKVVSPGITGGNNQPLNLRSIQQVINQSGLVGTVHPKNDEIISGPCWESNSALSLARLVSLLDLHFENVRKANKQRWEQGKPGYLCTNFGVGSHIRLLRELIRYVAAQKGFEPRASEIPDLYEELQEHLKPVFKFIAEASDEEFSSQFKVMFGSGGFQEYFYALVALVRASDDNFKPDGYEQFLRDSSSEEAVHADREVQWIQRAVHRYIIDKLRTHYGSDYFEMGVPKEIQKDCYNRKIDDDDNDLPVDSYLDWIHLQKIITQKDHREIFIEVLSIQLNSDKDGQHFYNGWFKDINLIRRVAAHPMGRTYTEKHLKVLSQVGPSLRDKLPGAYLAGAPDDTVS